MIFQEKKVDAGWEYKVEDVFGTIKIRSDVQLDGDMLDDMVSLLLRQDQNAGTVQGSVRHDRGTVEYTFTRESQWSEATPEEEWNESDQLCNQNNISTSIDEAESVSSQTLHWINRILRKLRRSVGAFLEVWRNPQ